MKNPIYNFFVKGGLYGRTLNEHALLQFVKVAENGDVCFRVFGYAEYFYFKDRDGLISFKPILKYFKRLV